MDNTFVFFPLTALILSAYAHTFRQKKVLSLGKKTLRPILEVGGGRVKMTFGPRSLRGAV